MQRVVVLLRHRPEGFAALCTIAAAERCFDGVSRWMAFYALDDEGRVVEIPADLVEEFEIAPADKEAHDYEFLKAR